MVCFDNSPVKLIFWRGIRYGPGWVSENENWMSDQSLETWGNGKNDIEGCFEHMQDRHCRFSHVRIIENNEARAVVHWRYAPVSSHDHTWMPDPKPDGSAGWMNTIISIPMDQPSEKSPGIRGLQDVQFSFRNHCLLHNLDRVAKRSSKTTMCMLQIMITIHMAVSVDPARQPD